MSLHFILLTFDTFHDNLRKNGNSTIGWLDFLNIMVLLFNKKLWEEEKNKKKRENNFDESFKLRCTNDTFNFILISIICTKKKTQKTHFGEVHCMRLEPDIYRSVWLN